MSNYLVSANDLTTISLGEQDTVTSVLQNIAVILSTPKGTVPCYREFGIDIANILDRPENVAQPMLCAAIKEAIERFEPRATYMGTTFKEAPDTPGRMVDILVATGSKNGSISVAGTDVAIKGLAALAYKAKISQSDLDDALAAVLAAKADKATTLGGYGITDAYTKDEINAKISAVYKPAGSVVFSALPALAENVLGNVYNVTDAFTTTNNFVEGAGNKYPKGTNVVVVKVGDAYKYDVLAGFVDLSGYVEKEAGKGLSDENFTAALKDKLDGIEAGANKYVHPTHTAAASGLYKTTVDEEGHVTDTIPVTKDDITGLGIPAQDTTYDEATTAKAGLMSAADKTKLDGMDTTIDKAIANHTATDAEVSEMLAEIYGE